MTTAGIKLSTTVVDTGAWDHRVPNTLGVTGSQHPRLLTVLWLEKTDDVEGKATAVPSMVTSGVSSPFTSLLRVVAAQEKWTCEHDGRG
jgi:glycine/D-amino acid oxidase-like deaminating enzyme